MASAALNEPIGIAFGCGVLYVGCYGGQDHGTICAISPMAFAIEVCTQIEAIYDAIGFVSKGLGAATVAARAARDLPFREAVAKLDSVVQLLLRICEARSAAIGSLKACNPEGSFSLHSVRGMEYTVENLSSLGNDLEAAGIQLDPYAKVRSMVNESDIEGNSGRVLSCYKATTHPA
eukprot:7377481-Prymnesium_polylepis.1